MAREVVDPVGVWKVNLPTVLIATVGQVNSPWAFELALLLVLTRPRGAAWMLPMHVVVCGAVHR